MSIRKNVLKVKRQMLFEIDEPGDVSPDVQQKALKAVSGGQGSGAWREYMTMFVEDPATLNDPQSLSSKQLARLMGEDDTAGKPEFDEVRAYMAADGTCTTETLPNFGRNASIVLDKELPQA